MPKEEREAETPPQPPFEIRVLALKPHEFSPRIVQRRQRLAEIVRESQKLDTDEPKRLENELEVLLKRAQVIKNDKEAPNLATVRGRQIAIGKEFGELDKRKRGGERIEHEWFVRESLRVRLGILAKRAEELREEQPQAPDARVVVQVPSKPKPPTLPLAGAVVSPEKKALEQTGLFGRIKKQLKESASSKATLEVTPQEISEHLKSIKLREGGIIDVKPEIAGDILVVRKAQGTLKTIQGTPRFELQLTTRPNGELRVIDHNVQKVIFGGWWNTTLESYLTNLHRVAIAYVNSKVGPNWEVAGFNISRGKLIINFKTKPSQPPKIGVTQPILQAREVKQPQVIATPNRLPQVIARPHAAGPAVVRQIEINPANQRPEALVAQLNRTLQASKTGSERIILGVGPLADYIQKIDLPADARISGLRYSFTPQGNLKLSAGVSAKKLFVTINTSFSAELANDPAGHLRVVSYNVGSLGVVEPLRGRLEHYIATLDSKLKAQIEEHTNGWRVANIGITPQKQLAFDFKRQ